MATPRKNAAARALAKRRMVKMTPEDRARVARLGGLAKAKKNGKGRKNAA